MKSAGGGTHQVTVIDSHAHVWGEGFLPAAFFRDAAAGWAAKAANRRSDIILPKLLAGVVDASGEDFIANMDRAGVDATLDMMIDVGAPVFGEEPEVPVEAQVDFYGDLQKRHKGRLYSHVAVA
ncbi:MAG TPA: hypothetical protein VG758_20770 [Hyphomicrobiaceae bacterium]|jgi:hypothetical protein|nr:hypothetical protein [Hyphomicrobiaceae bacterium]